ncbi:Hg(II)-responsive transcriptional regulator [Alcanivorax sp. S71-1-4]|jgi:MerR family mercuric resistance operon transcriptional regulator|uniref:Hg(II)-responsive transcriptional regulator n=1 Tax=Gammaproteobacteria TaxID=1236 RepID=UPI001359C15E|nr:Hg(II)-responsive transcriptional regulator [Alcanivorax sp. S71-1-4]KAF0809720.1 putative MerR family transcriptional regulator [Alcanivorax sp. S71-1-4]
MMNDPPILTIGAFAKAAEVNVETIRFYQRKGLLPEPDRLYGRIRRYGPEDVARVRFVKSAQRLGFNLDEVSQLLQLEDGTHCSEAAELAALQLTDVRAKLADLSRIEAVLSRLVNECHAQRGNVSCPLIDSLHGS